MDSFGCFEDEEVVWSSTIQRKSSPAGNNFVQTEVPKIYDTMYMDDGWMTERKIRYQYRIDRDEQL